MKREDIYYQAMLARDHRFDGKFFVGVKSTGVYCRPICPARPKRENVEFFSNYLAAEKAGYRPCLRCRPECAPHSPAWMGKSAIVQRALRVLSNGSAFNEDEFASLFGVTARHLRRIFQQEIGKTPKQLAFENRLNLARKLIAETALPITEIAFASGFESIRRFNDAFRKRFKRSPSEIRRLKVAKASPLTITLAYRPPYDFDGLLHVYQKHQVGLLERFEKGKMIRVLSYNGKLGSVEISNVPEKSCLAVHVDFPDTTVVHLIISKVRQVFDLDSDPLLVANALESDPALKKILRKYPGIRLPSGWESFEVAVSAILGQLVSVERGRALVNDLIEHLGELTALSHQGSPVRLFPTAKKISASDLDFLKTTRARKETLKAFAKAIASGKLSLDSTQDPDDFREKLMSIRGIGPWTASYITLKAIRHTDAFPATDLILARALKKHPQIRLKELSPWQGYAAALLWREYAQSLKK